MSNIDTDTFAKPSAGFGQIDKLTCWIKERLRTEFILQSWLSRWFGLTWRDICNRIDELSVGPDGVSRFLDAQDSSYLTVAKIFPEVGRRIWKRCSKEYPILLTDAVTPASKIRKPEISIIIPFAGRERLPLLRKVLNGFFAQDFQDFQIILVRDELTDSDGLPVDDRLLQVSVDESPGIEFNKSRMFNRGVQSSTAAYVLLHDADILVPSVYLTEIKKVLDDGWEVFCPIRFLFYFTQAQTKNVAAQGRIFDLGGIAEIRQNFAGGSLAITREAYGEIGGFDESFRGWGGEDVEFLDRAKSRRFHAGRLLPAVHLWHPHAEGKSQRHANLRIADKKLSVSVALRIETLRKNYSENRLVSCDT